MTPCEPLIETANGRSPVVTDEFGCLAQLVLLDASAYPAIEQVISDSSVQLRNGSAQLPIELPYLQKQVGGSFARMIVQDSTGKWYAFVAPQSCVNQRLIISNGSFAFVDDILPAHLASEICPVFSTDDFDYIIGAKTVTLTCSDGSQKDYLKWVLVPKATVIPPTP